MTGADDSEAVAAVRRDLMGLAEAIATAGEAVRQGLLVDLTGLDQKVAVLCQAIERLHGEQRSGMAEQLLGLIAGLDLLSEDLTRQREQMADPPASGPSPGQAAAAYRKSRS